MTEHGEKPADHAGIVEVDPADFNTSGYAEEIEWGDYAKGLLVGTTAEDEWAATTGLGRSQPARWRSHAPKRNRNDQPNEAETVSAHLRRWKAGNVVAQDHSHHSTSL